MLSSDGYGSCGGVNVLLVGEWFGGTELRCGLWILLTSLCLERLIKLARSLGLPPLRVPRRLTPAVPGIPTIPTFPTIPTIPTIPAIPSILCITGISIALSPVVLVTAVLGLSDF